MFDEADRARGRLEGEDCRGNAVVFNLSSLALGAVQVDAGQYVSHFDVAAAAAEAKKQAKRLGGNALFVERRRLAAQDASAEA